MAALFPSRQFRELVQRQLALFEQEHHDLVRDAREALRAWGAEPDAEQAQELYGEFDQLSEYVEDELDTMFRSFQRTLDEPAATRYRAAFARGARKAYRDLLPRLTFDAPEDQLPG